MASKLANDLRWKLGGIPMPILDEEKSKWWDGDNLAIFFCSHYDNPDQEEDDEYGWTSDGIRGHEMALDAIHEHYAPTIEKLLLEIEEKDKLIESVKKDLTKTQAALKMDLTRRPESV